MKTNKTTRRLFLALFALAILAGTTNPGKSSSVRYTAPETVAARKDN